MFHSRYITRFIIVLFLLALSACNSGGGGSGGGSTSLSVITISGVQASLNGTYTTGCRTKSGVDVVEGLVINGTNWSYARSAYSTSDGSCSAGETLDSTIIATISASGATSAITGWSDSGLATAAPMAADASGSLSNTESYTALSLTAMAVTGAGAYNLGTMGDSVNFYYIVDDTGLSSILYIPDFDAVDPMVSATPSGNFVKL